MNHEAFSGVRAQIGSCGLWCGSCAVGNGCIAEMACGLRDLLVAYDAPDFAPLEEGWGLFLKALGSLNGTFSCPGCRRGGGRDDCELRACARGRGVEHCTACPSFGSCGHNALLEHMRTAGAKVGLSVLMPDDDPEGVVEEWTRRLVARWPCCILFAEGRD